MYHCFYIVDVYLEHVAKQFNVTGVIVAIGIGYFTKKKTTTLLREKCND